MQNAIRVKKSFKIKFSPIITSNGLNGSVEDDLNDSNNNNEQNNNRNKGCKHKTTRKKGKEKRTVSLKD